MPRPWPSASRPDLRRFPVRPLRLCCQNRGYSPHGLRTLHRAPGPIARSGPRRSPVGVAVDQTSSPEVSSPLQRSQYKASTFSLRTIAFGRKRPLTPAPSATGLLHPLRSTLAVSHDLGGLLRSVPCRRLRRLTLLGFTALQGFSRLVEDGAVTSSVIPSWRFPLHLPPTVGDPKVHGVTLRLQGIALRVDRRRQLQVSRPLGLDPSWALSCGTASHLRSRLPGTKGLHSPVTRPNCQRAAARCGKTLRGLSRGEKGVCS